jgi:hypothetical protein
MLHGVVIDAIGVVLFSSFLTWGLSSDESLGAVIILTVPVPTSIFIFWRMSRLASLAQLSPHLMTVADFSELRHDPQDIAVLALFLFLSANAARGTFDWHRLIRAPSAIEPTEPPATSI